MSGTKTTKINLQRLEQIINWPSAFPLKLYLIEYTEYRMLFFCMTEYIILERSEEYFSVNIYNVAYCNKSNIKKNFLGCWWLTHLMSAFVSKRQAALCEFNTSLIYKASSGQTKLHRETLSQENQNFSYHL